MEDVITQMQDFARNALRNCSGDFWKFSAEFMEQILKTCEENRLFVLLQSVAGNGRIIQMMHNHCHCIREPQPEGQSGTGKLDPVFIEERITLFEEELYQLTDCSKLRINSFEDFQSMYTLFIANVMAAINDIYRRKIEKKDARRAFDKRLDYLRRGAAKQSL